MVQGNCMCHEKVNVHSIVYMFYFVHEVSETPQAPGRFIQFYIRVPVGQIWEVPAVQRACPSIMTVLIHMIEGWKR